MYVVLASSLAARIDFNLLSAMNAEKPLPILRYQQSKRSIRLDLAVNEGNGISFDPCRCTVPGKSVFDHQRNMAVCNTCKKPRRIWSITYHPFCYECGTLFTYKVYRGKEKFPFCPECE